jgi:hypothetical protein
MMHLQPPPPPQMVIRDDMFPLAKFILLVIMGQENRSPMSTSTTSANSYTDSSMVV